MRIYRLILLNIKSGHFENIIDYLRKLISIFIHINMFTEHIPSNITSDMSTKNKPEQCKQYLRITVKDKFAITHCSPTLSCASTEVSQSPMVLRD